MELSELLVYQVATYAFGGMLAIVTPLWLIARNHAKGGRYLVLAVVGRAVQHLTVRGVTRDKALQMVAPELMNALAERSKTNASA